MTITEKLLRDALAGLVSYRDAGGNFCWCDNAGPEHNDACEAAQAVMARFETVHQQPLTLLTLAEAISDLVIRAQVAADTLTAAQVENTRLSLENQRLRALIIDEIQGERR